MTSVFIDPHLLACPRIEEGKDHYEGFIYSLINWKDLSNSSWIKPYILSSTASILSTINKYPLWDDLKKANSTFGIDYISPDSVMKLVNSFLSKFKHIDEILEIEAINYDNFNVTPNILDIRKSENDLNQALKDLIVVINIKCKCHKELFDDHVLVTNVSNVDTLEISFELLEVLFNPNSLNQIGHPLPSSELFRLSMYVDFDELSRVRNIELVPTNILPEEKSIKISGDHHGNDLLQELAMKLVRSKYVISVVNNLDYNGHTDKFIHRAYSNGQIDIFLIDTDEGYGIRIQTTGRNLFETIKIGKMLSEEYN
jgi:hypothetical protein